MEELKLLLELGPNLTAGGVEAFGYYLLASLVGNLIFGSVIIAMSILLYKGVLKGIQLENEKLRRGGASA